MDLLIGFFGLTWLTSLVDLSLDLSCTKDPQTKGSPFGATIKDGPRETKRSKVDWLWASEAKQKASPQAKDRAGE